MEGHHRLLILILALTVAVPIVFKSRRTVEQTVPAAFGVPAPRGYVGVSGAVRRPGVYPIAAKTLTVDAIKMADPAGGILRMKPTGIETQPVKSGESLQVSIDGTGSLRVTRGALPAAQRLILGIPLDLNRITAEELERVPGIGPTMAADIITWRQNIGGSMAVGDLQRVPGIGEKRYSTLKKHFQ